MGLQVPLPSIRRIIQSKTRESSAPDHVGQASSAGGGMALTWTLDTCICPPCPEPERHQRTRDIASLSARSTFALRSCLVSVGRRGCRGKKGTRGPVSGLWAGRASPKVSDQTLLATQPGRVWPLTRYPGSFCAPPGPPARATVCYLSNRGFLSCGHRHF